MPERQIILLNVRPVQLRAFRRIFSEAKSLWMEKPTLVSYCTLHPNLTTANTSTRNCSDR